jgi:protein TonB
MRSRRYRSRMRVLVVDQDSASNEVIARSLRDLYTVDAVTNKGDCLDLLRSNTFEVIVATERLEDGSGLELLGTIAKRWPSVLRIFAADRQRLQLLKGRLGPFELFQTLTYPIDPDRLIATLNLAGAAQDANADTSNIQHVVLSGEPPAEAPEEIEQAAESGESEEFPAPQPVPRAASMEQAQPVQRLTRSAVRAGPSHRPRSVPGQRPRGNGSAGPPTSRMAAGPPVARGAAPSPSLTSEASRPLRHGRPRSATNRAPPVRFPPLERSPPLEPPQGSSGGRSRASQTDSFAEAAAMARAARSNFESSAEEFDARRLAIRVGGGAAVVLAAVLLGFKLFGSKSDAPRPAAPLVAQAPQYSQEVVELLAQTESAFKADDFKDARTNVDKLRQIAPSHPRLAFFDGLLAQHSDTSKGSGSAAASGHGTSKRGTPSSHPAAAPVAAAATSSGAAAQTSPRSAASTSPAAAATSIAAARDLTSTTSARSAPGTDSTSTSATGEQSFGLPPETPPGLTRSTSATTVTPPAPAAAASSGSTGSPTTAAAPAPPMGSAPATTSVATAESAPTTTSAPADAAPPAPAKVTSTSATRRASSGEPPPVVREAKLIRRVVPDYPSAAKRDGIQGSVDLEVTVSSGGVVEDVSVVRAIPPDMFEKSAVAAVRKWKYDPRFVDGLPTEARVTVHLDFGPGK